MAFPALRQAAFRTQDAARRCLGDVDSYHRAMLGLAVGLGLLGVIAGLIAIPLFVVMGMLSACRSGGRNAGIWLLGAAGVIASPILLWILMSAVPVLQFWEAAPSSAPEREGNLGDVFEVLVNVAGLPMLVVVAATVATVRFRPRPQPEVSGVHGEASHRDRPLFEP